MEPLEQNQFITPSTILKLMNCVAIPVWTFLSHIWANPIASTTNTLWYKILSKSSNTKYKHELTKMEYINGLSVNINGLSKHSYEIVHQYMLTNSVQISCVTETNKQNTEVHYFPGYSTIPNNSFSNPDQSVGVLLALDVNIKRSVFNLEIEIQHSIWAICNVSTKSILVGGVYCRSNSIEDLKRVVYEIRLAIKNGEDLGVSNFLLLGDFNARHPSWGNKTILKGKF